MGRCKVGGCWTKPSGEHTGVGCGCSCHQEETMADQKTPGEHTPTDILKPCLFCGGRAAYHNNVEAIIGLTWIKKISCLTLKTG